MKLCDFEKLPTNLDDQSLIGNIALCTIAQYSGTELKKQSVFYGEIINIVKGKATIKDNKGEELIIPVNIDLIVFPPRGIYRLENGEVINDPDVIISWKVNLLSPLEDSDWIANTAPHIHAIINNKWEYEYKYDKEYLSRRMEKDTSNIIGKTVIIGISYSDPKTKEITRREQIDGIIIRASMKEGIVIHRNDNGEEYKLPPDITMIQKAPNGQYRLKSNGKVIVDPGFITTWVVNERS
jgi:hypothetical protein